MVICLEEGVDLHVAQLMPLPPTVSASVHVNISFIEWFEKLYTKCAYIGGKYLSMILKHVFLLFFTTHN